MLMKVMINVFLNDKKNEGEIKQQFIEKSNKYNIYKEYNQCMVSKLIWW